MIIEPKKKGNPNRVKKDEVTNKTTKEKDDVSVMVAELTARMAKLETENKELKESIKPEEKHDGKKHFDGARHFSYKLRGGIPVCSYESKPKDPTKDLLYKDGKGSYIDNHSMILKLSNGDEVTVMASDFGRDYKTSEKMIAYDHNGEEIFPDTIKRVKSYTFKTDEFGPFTVLPNCING